MTQAASAALVRALRVDFARIGLVGPVSIGDLHSRRWASITFSGERHRLRLHFGGAGARTAAPTFLDGLAERDFDLGNHVLIDIACVGETSDGEAVTLALEALTIEAD